MHRHREIKKSRNPHWRTLNFAYNELNAPKDETAEASADDADGMVLPTSSITNPILLQVLLLMPMG
jgi:hypothetical protein